MKAMILCAGFGTRLGHLTAGVPKPLLDLNGRPMIEYILVNLRRAGFDEIMINLHFKPEMIRKSLGDGSRYELRLSYSEEPTLLGTAGGVKNVEHFFAGGEEFLVHYGDIVTDQDFAPMLGFHRANHALATLLIHERSRSNSVVALDSENRIIDFLERPDDVARQNMSSVWVNSGVCICSRQVLSMIPPDKACDLPRDIFPRLVATRRFFGYPLSGYRCAVDSPERLTEATVAVANGRCCISFTDPPVSGARES